MRIAPSSEPMMTLDEASRLTKIEPHILQSLTSNNLVPHTIINDDLWFPTKRLAAWNRKTRYYAKHPTPSEMPPQPLREIDGLCSLRLPPPISGVYFLMYEGKLQYIGKSACIPSRILSHMQRRAANHYSNCGRFVAPFDEVYYVPVPKERLDEVERRYIAEYDPPHNLLKIR